MNKTHTPKVNDILHRVEGQYIDDGSETYQGMELEWQQWKVVKATPRGAWLQSVERPYQKLRFALIPGARWVSSTKAEALAGLIARKRRQLEIIRQQNITATETLGLAQSALAEIAQRAAQAAQTDTAMQDERERHADWVDDTHAALEARDAKIAAQAAQGGE